MVASEISSNPLDVEEVLGMVGLTDRMEHFPAQLSGGEQMASALAVRLALLREVSDIDVAFFDEPTANLDGKTARRIIGLMKKMRDDFHTTFVFSTHDSMVMDFAHRLVHLHDGQIVNSKKS